ncbi:OmpP1/FadL family transporter [Peteryoungia ipomoeae]|uniref:Long-chain fatty acid transporter n=1 Tax=Peteryoungia ipomoeae TaxID=1210932 RepID=A0A4S8P5E0_9HYPH|nr:outer membrane protein transport protein [Peteryoungia ipomoeae]THV25393.1 long-chain fatty acid transporter [Peteryoungia ipomoeae]
MANNLKKTTALGLIAACAFVGSAQAGGWNRGEADTDILFEDGTVAARGGVTFVMPQRGYDTINGVAATDDDFTQNYAIPSFAAKVKVTDNFACAFTYTQPFGADADYGPQAQAAGASSHKDFITNEYGATCAVNMDAGAGKAYLLGGVFMQDFDYTAVSEILNTGANGTLSLEDTSAYGYRLGAAYAIPEYAMRFQLMYRSKIDHTTNKGSFDWTELNPALGLSDARGSGTLPQSIKLSAQSGVAPGWLVYGSIKWTDWSVMDALEYSIDVPIGVPVLGGSVLDRRDVYNWKDGWTIQAGVGHSFNEKISGTVNLTWDKGVDSGADIYTDTWTLGAGVSAKLGPGELRAGGGVSYLTAGSQSVGDEALYNATADADWAYALTASYKISF